MQQILRTLWGFRRYWVISSYRKVRGGFRYFLLGMADCSTGLVVIDSLGGVRQVIGVDWVDPLGDRYKSLQTGYMLDHGLWFDRN